MLDLRLVGGSLQVRHELSGHPPGCVGPVVLLDEGERQIECAGHAGGCQHVAVTDVYGGGVDDDAAVTSGESFGVTPVGGGATSVEQASGGQDGGAGAERCHPSAATGEAADLVNDLGIVSHGLATPATRDDEGVERGVESLESVLALQGQAGWAGDRLPTRRGNENPVGRVGGAEVVRYHQARGDARDVEQFGVGIADNDDESFVHALNLCRSDRVPKISDVEPAAAWRRSLSPGHSCGHVDLPPSVHAHDRNAGGDVGDGSALREGDHRLGQRRLRRGGGWPVERWHARTTTDEIQQMIAADEIALARRR